MATAPALPKILKHPTALSKTRPAENICRSLCPVHLIPDGANSQPHTPSTFFSFSGTGGKEIMAQVSI